MSPPRRDRRRLTRLAEMGWDELLDRARQAALQRWEAARRAAGLGRRPEREAVDAGPPGRFFFDPDDVDGIAVLLRRRWPGQVAGLQERAEAVCRHRFDLLGYRGLDFGSPIDWHLDPVSGRRAPLLPAHRIRYLDYEEVGDAKVVWELNRHQHWMVLARARLLTGHGRYVDEIVAQWEGWWEANPHPLGINWASALEVAFRSLSWLWVRHLLAGSGLPASFDRQLVGGLRLNARHLEGHLSTYFSPNTHLLGEAVALFFTGTLLPGLPEAGRWRRRGWRVILEEAGRQVQPDGMHFEQSTYYHVYALDFFLHTLLLASRNGVEIPDVLRDAVTRQLEALHRLAPDGVAPRYGDDDGGRLFDGARNRPRHLVDPLATGAALLERGDLPSAVAEVPEETVWLLGEAAARGIDDRIVASRKLTGESAGLPRRAPAVPPRESSFAPPGEPSGESSSAPPGEPSGESSSAPSAEPSPAPASGALEHSGIHLMCAAPGDGPACRLAVDAGSLGSHRGGHGHSDALSVHLVVDGHEILTDPGTGVYVGPGDTRDWFRGTSAHSTVRVDGRDPATPAGPFKWSGFPEPRVERWLTHPDFDYFQGSHDGFSRDDRIVVHRRAVLFARPDRWLIHDTVTGTGVEEATARWHFHPEVELSTADDAAVVARRRGVTVALATASPSAASVRLEEGRYSPAYGLVEASRIVVTSVQAPPLEIVTALSVAGSAEPCRASRDRGDEGGRSSVGDTVEGERGRSPVARDPRDGQLPSALRIEPAAARDGLLVCRLGDGPGGELFAFGDGSEEVRAGEWTVRAEVVWARLDDEGAVSKLVAVGPASVRHGGAAHDTAGRPHYVWSRGSAAA